mmetsp:Transcript_27356/g.63242  ORF Transcript_27356/g.63242 Transcript_27356/m.63242 type:complete len:609 (-) Transcript_27356:240-2066(-)
MGNCLCHPVLNGIGGIGTLETLNANGQTESRPRLLRRIFDKISNHRRSRIVSSPALVLKPNIVSTNNTSRRLLQSRKSRFQRHAHRQYQQQKHVIIHSKLTYSSNLHGEKMEKFVHCLRRQASGLNVQELHFTGACNVGNLELELFVHQALLAPTRVGDVIPPLQLKKLSITRTYLVGSKALRNLSLLLRYQPELSYLDLSGHLNLFDGQWASYIALNRYGAVSHLDDNDHPAIQDFIVAATRHPSLESLILTGTNVGHHTATLLFQTLADPVTMESSKLKHLHLDVWVWNYLGPAVMSTLLKFLPRIHALDTLVLSSITLKRCPTATGNLRKNSMHPMSPTYMLHHIDFLNILYPNFNLWRVIAPDTAWGFLAISYEDSRYRYYDELNHGGDEYGRICHCCHCSPDSIPHHHREERGGSFGNSSGTTSNNYHRRFHLNAAVASYKESVQRWRQRHRFVLRNQLLMAGLPLPPQEIHRNTLKSLSIVAWHSCIHEDSNNFQHENDAIIMNHLLPDWKQCWWHLSDRYATYWPSYPATKSTSFRGPTVPSKRRKLPGSSSSSRGKRRVESMMMPLKLHHSPKEQAHYNFKACALFLLIRERLVPETRAA